jgi:hypothetical protein
MTAPEPTRTIVVNGSPIHNRCADGRACEEVTARLAAVDKARREGIVNEPAVERILAQARRLADAHQHGADENGRTS